MRKVVCLLLFGAFFMLPTFALADCELCGDINGDGTVNIVDLTVAINWLQRREATPACGECTGGAGLYKDDELEEYIEELTDYLFYGGPAFICVE
ncbi:MAG: hypothetical protein R3F48_09930 [Candidatus Zixiibacteriota bacterium]